MYIYAAWKFASLYEGYKAKRNVFPNGIWCSKNSLFLNLTDVCSCLWTKITTKTAKRILLDLTPMQGYCFDDWHILFNYPSNQLMFNSQPLSLKTMHRVTTSDLKKRYWWYTIFIRGWFKITFVFGTLTLFTDINDALSLWIYFNNIMFNSFRAHLEFPLIPSSAHILADFHVVT